MASWVGALRLQAIITGIVCASTVALAAPGSDRSSAPHTSRGADITRGIAFVLAPEWGVVHRNALRRMRDDVRARLRADDIRHDGLRISGGAVRFRVHEASAIARARESLAHAARPWNLTPSAAMPGIAVRAAPDGAFTLHLTGFGLASLHDAFIATAMTELKRWLRRGGFDDYLLTDDGERIRVEIPPLAGATHAGRQC